MKKIITLLFLMALVCVKGWGQTTTTTYTLTTSTTPAVTGNVTAANASIGSGISSQFTNNSTYGIGGGSWPGSTSTPVPASSTKYLQFSITPSAGYTLNISSLTLSYANNEFSFNDGLAIFYSTSSTFATSTQVFANSTYISGNSGTYSNSAVNASAGAGQTLYFRVYFYAVSFGVTFGDKSISFTGTTTPTGPALSATALTAFGNVCQNTTAGPNSFTLTGSNLTSSVTVNALTGFTYATTATGTYSSTLTLTPTSGAINQTVYVDFTPTAVQSYSGNISISGGGATSINVAASGSGVNSPPTVTTGTATSITLTSATVPGTITVTGCSAITAYGVEYSTTSGFANGTGTQTPGSNLSNSNFSVTLTGLTQSTTYYYHTYATNSGGTSYSAQGSFQTATPTLTATALTAFGGVCINTTAGPNSFTITGTNLTAGNVTVAALNGFTYATASAGPYTTTLTLPESGGNFSQIVYVEFSPTAVQSYSGNIVIGGGGAANINEAASGSGINTAPTVTAGAATGITLTSATVPGTITATGCTAVTAYGVEYSTAAGFANGSGTHAPGSNLSGTTFSVTLTGLTQSTTYYYHTYATNSGGTSYSAQGSFTTASPTIATGAISGSPFCVTTSAGAAVSVPFTSTGTFTSNTYTAQLSSATGSFTSPTAIGTFVSNANSGTISATIPANTATGTAYLIRVIANGPATTGTNNGTNLTINLAANSIAPTATQNINVNANGTTLTVTEKSTATSRIWSYSTTSGGPYTSTGSTATTYIPNFATQGTYYVVCQSTFACGTATSNEVVINVSAAITTGTITGSPFCAAAAVSVPFTSAGTFSGNTYTAQLSDASGSFSSPTAIGTLVSNANSGTISATIPATATSGSAYLIRVVSSSPAATGSNSSAITINAAPTITAFTASPTTLCLGSSTNLNATSPTVTQSGFAGVYAPANWTLSNNPSNVGGSVNSSSAPTSISFKGGNSGTGGYTDYSIGTIAASGTISFTWNYSTADVSPQYDNAAYVLNGTAVNISSTTNGQKTQNGTLSIPVTAGQTFALRMITTDGIGGAATTVFSNFSGPVSSPTINFYTASTGGTSIGSAASGTNFSMTPTTTGSINYYASATNTATGCVTPTRSSVAITVNPVTAFTSDTLGTSNNILCQGTQISYGVTVTGVNISYTWHSSATAALHPGTDPVIGTNSSSVTVTVPSSTTYYYVVVTGTCGTITSDPATLSPVAVKINVQPLATQQVCQNSTATTLSPSISGNDISYQWYVNTVNSNTGGTIAPGTSTNRLYTPPTNVADTLYYYMIASSADCNSATATTNTAQVIVNPPTAITTDVSQTPQTICQNTPATALSVTAVGGSLTYQWYSNTTASNSGGTSVGSANGGQTHTFKPPTNAYGTTYYYVVVTGSCTPSSVTSSVSGAITVNPATAITSNVSTTPQTLCQNSSATTLSVVAIATNIQYQWYSNTSNSNTGGSAISGATSSSYTPSTATAGTTYYYVVVSGDCAPTSVTSAVSGAVKVNPATAITSDISTTPQTICQNTASSSLSVTAVGTNITYQWFSSPNADGSSSTPISGATSSTFTPPTTAAGTTYYYVVVSGSCTPSSVTSSVSGAITVTPATAITSNVSTTPQTLCQNSTAATLSVTATGTGTLTYQWFSNNSNRNTGGSPISGAITSSYTPSTTTTGTTYYYVVVSGGSCAPASVTSAVAPVTVNVTPAATIAAGSSTSCGASILITFTGTPGATVSYTINGGTVQTVTIGSGGNVSVNTSSNANTYTYTITGITLGSCSGTTGAANQSTTVTVNAYPIATISVNPGTGYVQIGNTVQLTAGTGGGTWTSNNTPVATVGNTSGTVTGVTSGTATIGYSITQNGCSSSSSQLITVTADFITKQAGNFSDFHTWNIGTPNGVSPSSSPIPTSTNTVEVEHALTLDQNFSVGAGKNLNIGTGGTMDIAPNVMFISLGTVAFNGNHVTVRSTALGTGAIGYMENPIVGASNVTVERYIPLTTTNGSAGRTGRAWRLLTSPVTGMTIKQAWQEGKTYTGGATETTTGLGTIITGQGVPGTNESTSFDFIPASAHNTSILQYNPGTTTGTWDVLSNNSTTGTNVAVSTQPAWLLFVRGDRTANTAAAKGTTTLRATGTLNQGDQPAISIPGNKAYTLVGNPFASPIDFEQVYQNSQIAPQFITWNSKNGVYGSYTLTIRNGVNDYTTVPNYQISSTGTADPNAQYIMSSEGFFVQPAVPGTDATLVIPRASKNSGSASVGINPYRVSASTEGRLFINLNLAGSATDTAAVLADGVMARFDKSYAAAVDGDDIRKQSNFNENLGIESNSTSLMVEARPEVQKTDTLQLKLWNVTSRKYQLQLKGANFAQAAAQKGLHAYLEDSYLKTKQEISLSGSVTTIAFSVTSDALSYDSHRFRVVFESDASSILPITLTQIKAQLQNSGVSVSWSTETEVNVRKYTVERSVNGGSTFTGIATATAKNLGATQPLSSYETFDAAPVKGDNLYRIKVEGVDGKVTYTGVVKVTVGEDAAGKQLITLYPNPVSRREGKAWLNLKNVKAGDYLLSVYSESGQNIMEKKITVATGSRSQTESLSIPSSLAQGSYQLQLTNSNGTKVFTSKLIVGK